MSKRIYPKYHVSVHVILVGAPDITANDIASAIHDICKPAIKESLTGQQVIIENITTDARIIDGLRGEA